MTSNAQEGGMKGKERDNHSKPDDSAHLSTSFLLQYHKVTGSNQGDKS